MMPVITPSSAEVCLSIPGDSITTLNTKTLIWASFCNGPTAMTSSMPTDIFLKEISWPAAT
ncbi:hypothetical protein D3C86_1220290 [compost metagenome]